MMMMSGREDTRDMAIVIIVSVTKIVMIDK